MDMEECEKLGKGIMQNVNSFCNFVRHAKKCFVVSDVPENNNPQQLKPREVMCSFICCCSNSNSFIGLVNHELK